MATLRTIGTGIGGVGRSNITLGVTGVFESQATVKTVAMQNENSPLYVQQAIVKYAAATFTAPSNTGAVMIVLPEAGTQPVSVGINAAFVSGGLVLPSNGAALLTSAVALTNLQLSCASVISAMRAAVFATINYSAQAVTVTNATELVNLNAHGLVDGDIVVFGAATIPTGLVAGTDYYVVNAAANTFQVSLTAGGTIETFTSDGASVTITTPHLYSITVAAHGLSIGDLVAFSTGGGLPAGLSTTVVYHVVSVTTNTFRVSLTAGGSPVDLLDDGTSPVVDEVANVTLHWL